MPNQQRIAELKKAIQICQINSKAANALYREMVELTELGVPDENLNDHRARAEFYEQKTVGYASLMAKLNELERQHQ